MPKKKTVTTTVTTPYQITTIPEEMLPPAYFPNKKTGDVEPYANVDGKYVPYDEAQIIFIERKIEVLKKQLALLKNKKETYDKPA